MRSDVLRDGHLCLSLMADGGIYEFEPMGREASVRGAVRGTAPSDETMMACVKGMETERAFLDALGQVAGWKIAAKQLELTDADGRVLARFEGRHMN